MSKKHQRNFNIYQTHGNSPHTSKSSRPLAHKRRIQSDSQSNTHTAHTQHAKNRRTKNDPQSTDVKHTTTVTILHGKPANIHAICTNNNYNTLQRQATKSPTSVNNYNKARTQRGNKSKKCRNTTRRQQPNSKALYWYANTTRRRATSVGIQC